MGIKRRAIRWIKYFACAVLAINAAPTFAADNIKIGFLVKMPDQGWFIQEQRSAAEAGKKLGFEVIPMGTPDADSVTAAIDKLAAAGAQGFVICTPDVRLGPLIEARAKRYNMKVVSVDDRLVDSAGKPMESIPHLGMSGYRIGQQVGKAIAQEIRRRGWPKEDVGALRIANDELPTARDRTNGATAALRVAGIQESKVFTAPSKSTSVQGGFEASMRVLAAQPSVRHWVIYALNEESVLGGVRATEEMKIDPKNVVGVGINGAADAFSELQKPLPTGFVGTIAVSSAMHGYVSASNLYFWITAGRKPPSNYETSGRLMLRDNWREVKLDLGL